MVVSKKIYMLVAFLLAIVILYLYVFSNSLFINPRNIIGKVYKKGVLHSKMVYANPKTSEQQCYRYESWYDLETGDFRIEGAVPGGKGSQLCRDSIDLVSGGNASILSLFPHKSEMRAKWRKKECGGNLGPPLVKIDPFSFFEQQLTNSEAKIFFQGKTKLDDKDFYVIRKVGPYHDTSFIYYDTESFFPYLEKRYDSSVVFGRFPLDYSTVEWKYPIGEVLNKDSLPDKFLEQKIPENFIFEDGPGC